MQIDYAKPTRLIPGTPRRFFTVLAVMLLPPILALGYAEYGVSRIPATGAGLAPPERDRLIAYPFVACAAIELALGVVLLVQVLRDRWSAWWALFIAAQLIVFGIFLTGMYSLANRHMP